MLHSIIWEIVHIDLDIQRGGAQQHIDTDYTDTNKMNKITENIGESAGSTMSLS